MRQPGRTHVATLSALVIGITIGGTAPSVLPPGVAGGIGGIVTYLLAQWALRGRL